MLDTILDRTVLPGYTSVGYKLRARTWDDLPSMAGKVVIVTGATGGIGLAAAEGFARLGADVRLLVRNAERGEKAAARVRAAIPDARVGVELCDVSDLASVRAFAEQFTAKETRLDVLVHNAGVLPPQRTLTGDGIELTFATNVAGPFLLTSLLAGLLAAGAPSRVINISSGGMYTAKLDVDDLQSAEGSFDGVRAYAQTKRAEVILTELWAERLHERGVVVHSMHPGWVDTPGVQESLPTFNKVMGPLLRDAAQGADTIVWLGAADEPLHSTGTFWHDRRARPTHRVPWTKETDDDRRRLWEELKRLTKEA
ncbi:MAG: SDR family NAD(P)-dependent oxidoreductase [Solirubrobacteraceae bacterium]